MGTIGLRVKINVSKIQKELLFRGERGTYLNATVFINDEPDQYGQHGAIIQDRKKGDEGAKIYIGNCKKFWSDEDKHNGKPPEQEQVGAGDYGGDRIPF